MKSTQKESKTPLSDKQEQKNAQRRVYYAEHKEKILLAKKIREEKNMKAKCEELQIPTMLAPFIKFWEPSKGKKDRVILQFDSKAELLGFLKKVIIDTDDQELIALRDKFLVAAEKREFK